MKESAHSFGQSAELLGVLTAPEPGDTGNDRPVVVLVNAGLLGRVGPFRLHVVVARKLAAAGFRTFRIDLSGIGDSGRHSDNRPRGVQHLGDIREAIDYLEAQLGAHSFVVMGICTGADNAHKAMREDDRVVGAVCIDGYSYPTLRFYLNRYLPKFVSAKSWKNLLKRVLVVAGLVSPPKREHAGDDQLDYRWKLPSKNATEADYRQFIERNVKLLCIYTSWRCNYAGQLADAFKSLDFGDAISARYLPNANHTFKVEEDRTILVREISDWLSGNWGVGSRKIEA